MLRGIRFEGVSSSFTTESVVSISPLSRSFIHNTKIKQLKKNKTIDTLAIVISRTDRELQDPTVEIVVLASQHVVLVSPRKDIRVNAMWRNSGVCNLSKGMFRIDLI